jgi:hypothetical protein
VLSAIGTLIARLQHKSVIRATDLFSSFQTIQTVLGFCLNAHHCSSLFFVICHRMNHGINGPVLSTLWRAIAEVKQRWLVIGWVTNPHWARVVGYDPFSLRVVNNNLRNACAPAVGALMG